MIHFDTSYWALSKLADPKYGAVGVKYRVVRLAARDCITVMIRLLMSSLQRCPCCLKPPCASVHACDTAASCLLYVMALSFSALLLLNLSAGRRDPPRLASTPA